MNPTTAALPARHEPSATARSDAADRVQALVDRVSARIAPTWPLDRFIAVNPFWGSIDQPVSELAAKLGTLSGASLTMPRAWYREAYEAGRLRAEHLEAALGASGADASVEDLVLELTRDASPHTTVPRVVDILDADRDLTREPSVRQFVTHDISQFCAAYFDDGQASFGPGREGGLYASFRRHALVDRSPEIRLGLTHHRIWARDLPATALEATVLALDALDLPQSEHEDYLWSLLLDQNGWASWCAYRRFTARMSGGDDDCIADLLAIRIAWEWLLHRSGGESVARRLVRDRAQAQRANLERAKLPCADWVLQAAMEFAYREPLIRGLSVKAEAAPRTAGAVQAVFCIDVRSEPFRRALEAEAPSVTTLGFAGFFGMPVEYRPLAAHAARPQLPGPLAAKLRVEDTGLDAAVAARRGRTLDLAATWKRFTTDAVSTFTFVEALGLGYAGKLLRDGFGLGSPQSADDLGLTEAERDGRKPRLVSTVDGRELDLAARADLAAGMLGAMSLTHDFARIVLLAGHGSETRNNAHAAGLDCGACCGQTGEVNARAAAALLNDPAVRTGLAARGIHVPEATWFLPALHNTTTDDVRLFDVDEVPASHRRDLDDLRAWLAAAGSRTRAARAGRLGLAHLEPAELDRAVRARARDWAEVRPEWGLADNAAFIVAPRERSRHLDLAGRSFLHEYRHEEDEGYRVLELIMTAPMVVTHWINFQYYASSVDNERYGSGNKVLHNVVGGHLGVFEGNGGDLRIGLPLQSVHDGTRLVHTPLRLSVFIEAPRDAIDAILARHAHVDALVRNGWLALLQVDADEGSVHLRGADGWHAQR